MTHTVRHPLPAARPRRLPLACALACAVAGAVAQAQVVVPPQTVVSNALAYSRRLQAAASARDGAAARHAQTVAATRPAVDARASAARYEGLENAPLGPGILIPTLETRYGASVGVTQALYTGHRLAAQQEGAVAGQLAAEAEWRAAAADTVLQALAAYWAWSQAVDSVAVAGAALTRLDALAADVRNARAAGLATEQEELATAVQRDQAQLRALEAHRRVELVRARLVFLAGDTLPTNAVPRPAPAVATPAPPLAPADVLVTQALAVRPERQARLQACAAAAARAAAARAERRPQVYLSARYEYANPNLNDFPPREEWRGDAFAAVSVAWNVLDAGLTAARAAEADAQEQQARWLLRQTEDDIALGVREAHVNLRDALARVAVTERAGESARRNLEAARVQWRNGLARHADVLAGEAALADAQMQAATARANVALARAALAHALGRPPPTEE